MKERITIAIDSNLLELLDMRSKIEGRTRSNMVERILNRELLKKNNSHGDSSRADKTEV